MAAADSPKETRSSVFARTANFTTKRALRAKEKVMQKLGKSAATKDETFVEFVGNFNKQQTMANRLNKEVKKYMDSLKSMSTASKNLGDCFHDLYEPEWARQAEVSQALNDLSQCHNELLTTLKLQLSDPVTTYFAYFSDVKTKISKHERKVVDYDRRKRHLEQLRKDKQTKGKISDTKLAQAEAEFEEARHVYDDLTNELYEELPTFYDSRIPFYASIFQSLYLAEAAFHSTVTALKTQLNDLMDVAAQDAATKVHSTRKPRMSSPVSALASSLENPPSDEANMDEDVQQDAEEHDVSEDQDDEVAVEQEKSQEDGEDQTSKEETKGEPSIPQRRDSIKKMKELAKPSAPPRPCLPSHQAPQKPTKTPPVSLSGHEDDEQAEQTEQAEPLAASLPEDHAESPGKSDDVIDSSVVYRVITTHEYQAQDEDELEFEKGELIDVMPFDDLDEQDEGWLVGVKVSDGMKGVFPENFTKRVD
ncbi:myc box-dependent-interacting protein 1-like [Corticium candelabrum]|uniref:myc box-dependent-interacting protein 1-like n=1 Tax=Corticium candelabrum TaxID=121492 RepID=UPI002E25B14E|nr:myc box-dependent-interacting protein 1-like [Corticium candelabrum]